MDSASRRLSLPKNWPQSVKTAVLHVIALARVAVVHARSTVVNNPDARMRLRGDLQGALDEIALLEEELRIKDARMATIDAPRRPHYRPIERMAILELRAARGWSQAQTARRFLVKSTTIASWLKRVDESSPAPLVQVREPVNKFPDLVRYLVRRLKVLFPSMGRKRIAQTLARAGLRLSASTVGRVLKGRGRDPERPVEAEAAAPSEAGGVDRPTDARTVTAKRPNHVWHVDLTVVPTTAGFWAPWFPLSLPQVWPFCWWVACAVDHYSRLVLGFAVFKKQPSSAAVRAFLGRAIVKIEACPKYIVCDQGPQFASAGFKAWCKRKNIRPRYGSSRLIRNCIFLNNTADAGGGFAGSGCGATLENCVFSGNSATSTVEGGGGVFCMECMPNPDPEEPGCTLYLSGCTFYNNSADFGGGLLAGSVITDNPCDVDLCCSTFYKNSAWAGGGVFAGIKSTANLYNNIIAFSTQGGAAECYYETGFPHPNDGHAELYCSDVWGNTGGDWADCIWNQGPSYGRNNLWADPLFCDPQNGDFTLFSNSPCAADPNCAQIGARGVGCGVEPPQLPSNPQHQARKNRYISIDPTSNGDSLVAIEVVLSSMKRCNGDQRRACKVDADCPGVCQNHHDYQCTTAQNCANMGVGGICIPTHPCVEHRNVGDVTKWIDAPFASSCVPQFDCAGQWFANLADNPVYRVWTEDTLHITDCEIVPVAMYDLRATADGTIFGDPLTIGTIEKPHVHYGDCVGSGAGYTPPDGYTNVVDVLAYLVAFQGLPWSGHTTWVDLEGLATGQGVNVPQQILNVSDLQRIQFAFKGYTYQETPQQEDPSDCPP